MSRTVYASQTRNENYTFHPGRKFSLNYYPETGSCYLVFLDDRQLAILREMAACFPKYHWIWGLPSPRRSWDASQQSLWNDITDFVDELEAALVSGCDSAALIAELQNINSALGNIETSLGPLAELTNLRTLDIPQLLAVLTNLAADTDALSNLASLPSLATDAAGWASLANLSELTNINGNLNNLATDTDALSNLDRLVDLANNSANLATLASEVSAINSDLDELANIATSLGNIDLDLDRINDITAAIRELHGDLGSLSLQQFVDDLYIQYQQDPDNFGFKDWLELLNLIKNLLPGATVGAGLGLLSSILEGRFKHNLLTILAYQATAQRGIQNAIAPFSTDTGTENEESMVKGIYDQLDKMPWLMTVVAALAEPTPAGETAAAVKLAATAKSWFDKAKSIWDWFYNRWINEVETPIPSRSVVESILDLAARFEHTDGVLGQENATQVLSRIADNLPEGVTLVDVFTSLQTELAAIATSVNSVNTTVSTTLDASLDAIATNVSAVSVSVDNQADDAALVSKLEEIRLMLETRMTAETVAGNTRKDEIEAVLDAIENVLGGSYVPS